MAELDLGGIDRLSVERWPWKAWDVTLDDHDVIHLLDVLGGRLGSIGMCGMMEQPKEG